MKSMRWMPAAALSAALVGCGEDPSDVTGRQLYGLWAAFEMVYTSQADPSIEADLVGTQGAVYTIRLRPDGTFESLLSRKITGSVTETGTYEFSGSRLFLDGTIEGERTWEMEFNESLLTVREADTTWDFDDDGTREPATLDMRLDRQ